MNQGFDFLGRSFSKREIVRTLIQIKKDNPNFLKGDFASRIDPFIFTSIAPPLFEWSNEVSCVFPALGSTSEFLLQFAVPRRSDLTEEAKSNCCYKLKA